MPQRKLLAPARFPRQEAEATRRSCPSRLENMRGRFAAPRSTYATFTAANAPRTRFSSRRGYARSRSWEPYISDWKLSQGEASSSGRRLSSSAPDRAPEPAAASRRRHKGPVASARLDGADWRSERSTGHHRKNRTALPVDRPAGGMPSRPLRSSPARSRPRASRREPSATSRRLGPFRRGSPIRC